MDSTTSTTSAATKYRRTRDAIRAWATERNLQPGDRLPPVRQLMEIHKVSYSTLMRALSELREMGIIEQRWGKGIFLCEPQVTARNLAVTCDALVSPRHPQITQILRGIATGVEERDWHMQVFPLPASTIFGGQEPSLLATLLRERRMDAVIALSPHTPEDIQQLHALGIPVVSVDNEYPGTDTPCVMPDADSATEQLLDHLANELGHRRFGLVLGPQSRQSNRLIRFSTILGQSLRRQFKERDLYCPISNQLNCNYRWEAAESTIRQWLTAASRPTALIFIDQTMAEQAAALAKELGLRVPDDLSITGWGGPARSWLTQIIPSYEAMGREAVILLDQQRAARLPRVVRLPVSLDVGKSTGRAR